MAVWIDEEACTGCAYCNILCPWEALGVSTESFINQVDDEKCVRCLICLNLCPADALGVPPCRVACPIHMDIPGVKTFLDKQAEYHGEVVEDVAVMQGWLYAAICCEAARLAVEQVGYENIDGPAMRRAMESMDLDLDGMIRITYGPEDRRGCRRYAVYEIQGGKRVRVSDWRDAPILSR